MVPTVNFASCRVNCAPAPCNWTLLTLNSTEVGPELIAVHVAPASSVTLALVGQSTPTLLGAAGASQEDPFPRRKEISVAPLLQSKDASECRVADASSCREAPESRVITAVGSSSEEAPPSRTEKSDPTVRVEGEESALAGISNPAEKSADPGPLSTTEEST